MFIRTEEEIYDTERTHDLEIKDNELYQTIAWLDRNPFLLGTIVKQAETIEELCDEFVEESTPLMKPSIRKYNKKLFINNIKDLSKYAYKIYGAIWTPKGLIFVAKMNEKGEFELIWKEETLMKL